MNTARDVLIIGGGPAGLSAALTLLRARRSVTVIDAGEQRNLVSPAMHGFISREGTPPSEFLKICRSELSNYGAFEHFSGTVSRSHKEEGIFRTETECGRIVHSYTVLLATGVTDTLPAIKGIEAFYGRSVHHCPYCDGWAHRDQPIVTYGADGQAANLAWELTVWSADVTLLVEPHTELEPKHLARLNTAGVRLIEGSPVQLEGDHQSTLTGVKLSDGQTLPAGAFFFVAEEAPRADLAEQLGCEFDGKHPGTGETHCTSVEGCFAAGNMCKGRNMVVIAAAQGAVAAIAINEYLLEKAPGRRA